MTTSGSLLFNLTLPACEYLGNTVTPTKITLYAYQIGRFLSYFSGSYLLSGSAVTLYTAGISGSYSHEETVFNLTLPENSYFGNGGDTSYETTLYNYYGGRIIGDYSASTINEISVLSIGDFVRYYVG